MVSVRWRRGDRVWPARNDSVCPGRGHL